MAEQMYATVSDSRDDEFAAGAGWLNRSPQQLHLQKTYNYWIKHLSQIAT